MNYGKNNDGVTGADLALLPERTRKLDKIRETTVFRQCTAGSTRHIPERRETNQASPILPEGSFQEGMRRENSNKAQGSCSVEETEGRLKWLEFMD